MQHFQIQAGAPSMGLKKHPRPAGKFTLILAIISQKRPAALFGV